MDSSHGSATEVPGLVANGQFYRTSSQTTEFESPIQSGRRENGARNQHSATHGQVVMTLPVAVPQLLEH